nr:SHOCT domain-containing protein [uncultured Anaerosporobacter sp.]
MSKRVRVKPSKGQSMAGFFCGLIFCFIGFFTIIPIFGAFGLIWTLFAIIMTITQGINAFTDKGIASHEITIDDDMQMDKAGQRKSPEERMKELQSLYDKGLVTGEEYQQKRKNILEDI